MQAEVVIRLNEKRIEVRPSSCSPKEDNTWEGWVLPLEQALPPEQATPSKSKRNSIMPFFSWAGKFALSTVYRLSLRSEPALNRIPGTDALKPSTSSDFRP